MPSIHFQFQRSLGAEWNSMCSATTDSLQAMACKPRANLAHEIRCVAWSSVQMYISVLSGRRNWGLQLNVNVNRAMLWYFKGLCLCPFQSTFSNSPGCSGLLRLTWLQRMKTICFNNWRSFVSMAMKKKAALLPGLSFSFVFRTWNRLFSNLCCVQFGGVHSYAIVRHVLVWCHRYALSNHRATISVKNPPG